MAPTDLSFLSELSPSERKVLENVLKVMQVAIAASAGDSGKPEEVKDEDGKAIKVEDDAPAVPLKDEISLEDQAEKVKEEAELAVKNLSSKGLQAHLRTIGGGLPLRNDLDKLKECLDDFFSAANLINGGLIVDASTDAFFKRLRNLEAILRKLHENLDNFQNDHNLSTDAFDPDTSLEWLTYLVSIEDNTENEMFRTRNVTQEDCLDFTRNVVHGTNKVSDFLKMYAKKVIPAIKEIQDKAVGRYLNISGIATFFSAVTAAALAFSVDNVDTSLDEAVNAFWFISLAFSVTSAVLCLVGVSWRQSAAPNPKHALPDIVFRWLVNGPEIYLIVAAGAFSLGLGLFVFENSNLATSIISIIIIGINILSVLLIAAWFYIARQEERYKDSEFVRSLGRVANWFGEKARSLYCIGGSRSKRAVEDAETGRAGREDDTDEKDTKSRREVSYYSDGK